MARKRRKPKLSKKDLKEIAYGLDKFGDMLVMMGEIVKMVKEVGDFDRQWRKLFFADPLSCFQN